MNSSTGLALTNWSIRVWVGSLMAIPGFGGWGDYSTGPRVALLVAEKGTSKFIAARGDSVWKKHHFDA
jgi:hypothetical protein